jgi:hypothetical protein
MYHSDSFASASSIDNHSSSDSHGPCEVTIRAEYSVSDSRGARLAILTAQELRGETRQRGWLRLPSPLVGCCLGMRMASRQLELGA